jgi:hypothetical protein
MALPQPLARSAASSATLFAAGALLCDAGDPRRSGRSAQALLSRASEALDALAATVGTTATHARPQAHARALPRALACVEEARACCAAAARAMHRARAFPGAAAPLMPLMQNRDALSSGADDDDVERHIRAALARATAALTAAERILGAADGAGALLLRARAVTHNDDDDDGDADADADAEEEVEALWRGWVAFGAHPFFSHGRARARAETLFRGDAAAAARVFGGSGGAGADASGGGTSGAGAAPRVLGYFVALRAAAAAAVLWRLAREQRSHEHASASASDVAVADRCAATVLRALRLARHARAGGGAGDDVARARTAMLLLPWEADAAHTITALLASAPADAAAGAFSSAWAAQRTVAAAWGAGERGGGGGARLRGSARAHAALCESEESDGDGDGDGSPAAVFHARRAPPRAPLRACALRACGGREAHAHAHLVCSRCRAAAYCCAAHAAAHWRAGHSAECAAALAAQRARR